MRAPSLILNIFQIRKLDICQRTRYIAAIPQAVVFPWLSHSHVHVAVFDLASHLCNRYKVFHRNTLVCKRNTYYLSFAIYGGVTRRSSLRRSEGGATRNRTPVIGFGDRRSTIEL